MIPHPPGLDTAYGAAVWEPTVTATFTDPAGKAIPNAAVSLPAGTYVNDGNRWPRTEVTLSLPVALTPGATAPPVTPFGSRLILDVGFRYFGQTLTFRLATLDVVETEINRPAGTMMVRAASFEARVDEDRYAVPVDSPGGTGTSLITFLVRRTLGPAHPVRNLVAPGDDVTFPARTFSYDGGVWAVIEAIADEIKAEAYFDSTGTLVIRPTPVKGTPVMTLRTGDGGGIVGYRSQRGWAPNRCAVVYTDSAGARRVGLYEDTNASSATRVSGPYGRHTDVSAVPVFEPAVLPTQAAADAAAATRYRRVAARYRSVDVETIPAPWLEPGDTVRVDLLGGLSETLLVAAHAFPLDGLDVATVTGEDDTFPRDLASPARLDVGE